MSIGTYAQLKTAMANWLRPNATASSDMVARIPEYISLAQGELNALLATHPRMQTIASLTITSGFATVPDRLLNVIAIQLSASPWTELDVRSTPLAQSYGDALTLPTSYAWVGSQFAFDSLASTTAYIAFHQGLAALSADADTDWLLTTYPNAYLYGALRHADRRLVDEERLSEWKDGFVEIIDLITSNARLAHSGIIRSRPSAGPA